MTTNTELQQPRYLGLVKWFNNKTGYGFITVLGSTSDDQHKGKDIFVHYKSIRGQDDANYKYLVQGEYVQFHILSSTNEKHEFHAVDITGIQDGPTMCDTRRVASLSQQRERAPVVNDRDFVRSNRRNIRKV